MKLFMRTYWLVIAGHFFAQLFSFLFLPYEAAAHQFYFDVLLYPSLFMCAILGLAQIIQRITNQYSFYSLFVAGTLISMEIIHLNMDIRIIGAAMLLPIFASTLFFRLPLTLFTAVLQMIGFCMLYRWDEGFQLYLSAFDLIAILLFFIFSTLVASIIIISGSELVNDLEETMLAKQDLMVENVVMTQQSKIDALTQLYNHISFHEFYEKALEFADQGASFHLALIDIDNFKAINDTYGHRVGDIVLSRVAKVIKESLASTDLASRYGGEEFALLLFEQSFENAYALVEKIRTKLAALVHAELEGRAVTVSIGLKSAARSVTKITLFEAVDGYLYAAKRTGKNKTVTAFHTA